MASDLRLRLSTFAYVQRCLPASCVTAVSRRLFTSWPRPVPASPTSRPASGSGPAKPATASRSPPPRNGSPASATRITKAASTPSSPDSDGCPCSSSTKSATSLRRRSRQPVLTGRIRPRRTRQRHRHLQQTVSDRWGEVFGDATVAAMIDRLVHPPKSSTSKATATDSKTETSGGVPTDDPAAGQKLTVTKRFKSAPMLTPKCR
jgi:hypothetical protein